ncbi:C-5 sterol desaturase [Histoplasma capsulatum]|uniref:C-5 sterol desaturase n=1 Tax=Ajellomyces capsulatus TaxID=5037 RepID=A0A8A1M7M5_AJECA|nr:C-5 sterol desaturase [Histoplasma capsulatum]
MDVILEVFDTLIFDYFYAKLSSAKDASAISSRFNNSLNETKYDFVGAGGYVYQPTTTYFKLQPSIYAYTSSLPRDYIWRQLFTLYIITWYDMWFSDSSSTSSLPPSPTSSSSTNQPSITPNTSKTKSAWKLNRLQSPSQSWPSSQLPSSSSRSADMQKCTTTSKTLPFRSTTTSNSLSSSSSPTSSSTGSTAAFTTPSSISTCISPTTNGLCQALTPPMPSTPSTATLRVSPTTFSPSSSPCRNLPMSSFLSSSTSGLS